MYILLLQFWALARSITYYPNFESWASRLVLRSRLRDHILYSTYLYCWKTPWLMLQQAT